MKLETRLLNYSFLGLSEDVGHIFEHAIIFDAYRHLKESGISLDTTGWISGKSFEERAFITAGFYDELASKYFDDYIENAQEISDESIKLAIQTVELEDRVSIAYDISKIRECLLLILKQDAQSAKKYHDYKIKSSVEPKKSHNISITVTLNNLSSDQQKLSLRLRPILVDIITNRLSSNEPVYSRGDSPILSNQDSLEFVSIFSIKSGADFAKLAKVLEEHLHAYPVDQRFSDIKRHFEVFTNEPLWRTAPIDYYQNTGIITSVEELRDLATEENMSRIFSQLKIKIDLPTDEDYDAIEL